MHTRRVAKNNRPRPTFFGHPPPRSPSPTAPTPDAQKRWAPAQQRAGGAHLEPGTCPSKTPDQSAAPVRPPSTPRPTLIDRPPPRSHGRGRNHPAMADKNGRTLNAHAPRGQERPATADSFRPPTTPPKNAGTCPAESGRRPTQSRAPAQPRRPPQSAAPTLPAPTSNPRPWPKSSGQGQEEWPNSQRTRTPRPRKTGHGRLLSAIPAPRPKRRAPAEQRSGHAPTETGVCESKMPTAKCCNRLSPALFTLVAGAFRRCCRPWMEFSEATRRHR